MSTLTTYGTAADYGGVDDYYGRISAELSGAQLAKVRETALKVSLVDERTNRWEQFVQDTSGEEPKAYSSTSSADPSYTQRYWSYRGQCDVCVLNNGDIVRVRLGIDDRQVYIQTITDPTNASQWSGGWSLLYSGTHYAVAIAPSGASSYIVYTAKVDGLYRNNSLQWAATDIMALSCHRDTDNRQMSDILWVSTATPGTTVNGAQVRKFSIYFTEDLLTVDPYEVEWNWFWQRSSVASIKIDDSHVAKVVSYPAYASPDLINTGESIMCNVHDVGAAAVDLWHLFSFDQPRLVRGFPGSFGHTTVSGCRIVKLSDGYYYLFYVEAHVDNEWEFTSNIQVPLIWQRSKDCVHWSEPVHTGFNVQGFAGIIEAGNYIFVCGRREVYRRPNTSVTYEISNYVPEVEWESPRDNQAGTGTVKIANPEGVNDYLQDLNDKRIIIEPGMRVASGAFDYAKLDDFWLSRITESTDGKTRRLTGEFGNIWDRLSNPLRDTYNFIGRTDYNDWESGATNEPFNYYFPDSSGSKIGANDMVVTGGGTVIWTGWKGYNPIFDVGFSAYTAPIAIVFRWLDSNNYLKFEYTGSVLRLVEVVNGTATVLQNFGAPSATVNNIGVKCTWRRIDIYLNKIYQATLFDTTYVTPNIRKPGYVGFQGTGTYRITEFHFQDNEFDYKSEDLVRQCLALGDYHDVKVGAAKAKQYALTWGPQTDLPNAADALRQLLESEKLELIWRDGFIEVGQFKSSAPIRTLQDEVVSTNEIGDINRRINLASVDGNDYNWMEIDQSDVNLRDRMIQAYFDLPELLSPDDVVNRAQEEIRRGKLGQSPGAQVPLQMDLWRMDPITIVDNAGNSKNVRIEGIKVTINQSKKPSQREELDTSLL